MPAINSTSSVAARLIDPTIFLGAGLVGAPALQFPGSPTTGLFQPAADTVGISVSSTEVLRVTSSGVGISTVASPSARLHVLGTTADQVTSIIQAAPAQTADILQIQNNAGSILARFTINGDLGINQNPNLAQIHITARLANVKGVRVSSFSLSGFNHFLFETSIASNPRMLCVAKSSAGVTMIRLGVGNQPFTANAGLIASSDVIVAVFPANTGALIGCFNPVSGTGAHAGFRCGEVVDGGNELRMDALSSGFTTNQLSVANRCRIFCRASQGLVTLLLNSATTANYQIAVGGNDTDNVRFIVNNSATTKGVTIGRIVPTGTEALANVHIFDAGIIGLAIEAESGQTANLTEWRDNTGAILAFVNASGDFDISGKLTVGGVIDPTALLLTGSSKKLGATDVGTIYLAPFSDATTGIQIRKADDATVIMNVDTTNESVGIGASSVNASAIFELTSTTKGILISRMTSVQRDAIGSPATGLLVYDTTNDDLNFFNSTAWRQFVNTPASSLTDGSVVFATGNAEVDDDNDNFFWDNINKGLGIGTKSIDASAMLEIDSTAKGFLPPRMTTVQRDAISSPSEGLIIQNTTTNQLNFFDGTSWKALSTV